MENKNSEPTEILSFKRLRTNLLEGKQIPSPLILASGTLTERFEQVGPFLEAGIGAVVPRTTRKIMERKVHPSPHLYQTGEKGSEMMLNAEWTGADIGYWRQHLEKLSETKQVVMSVSGRDVEGCVDVCKELDRYRFLYLEINVGCAHCNDIHGFITRNSSHITQLTRSLKDAGIITPIAIKLGHSDFIVELARVAKQSGADAIVAVNTFGPLFDFRIDNKGNAERVLGIQGARGGMSGSPLFNIALTDVARIKHEVDIPVIGCGGVSTEEHVVKMLMAGASAVQIYTAAHIRGVNAPQYFSSLNERLLKYLDSIGVSEIEEVKNKALALLDSETNLEPIVPEIDKENCLECEECLAICLAEAIEIQKKDKSFAFIDSTKCVGCGHCIDVCPTGSIR